MEKPSYTNSRGDCLQHSIIQRSGTVILFQHSHVQKHCFITRYVQALTVIIYYLTSDEVFMILKPDEDLFIFLNSHCERQGLDASQIFFFLHSTFQLKLY